METYLIAGTTLLAMLTGCVCPSHTSDDDYCSTVSYAATNALPCPLCKNLPTIRKTFVDIKKRPGLKPPADLAEPFHLYTIGCCTSNCMVGSILEEGRRSAYWTEDRAIALWNDKARIWEK